MIVGELCSGKVIALSFEKKKERVSINGSGSVSCMADWVELQRIEAE